MAIAVLAASLAGLWWSSRPQIDPRFVGRWESDDYKLGPFERWLYADGTTTTCEKVRQLGVKQLAERWYVDGGVLFVSHQGVGYVDTVGLVRAHLSAAWNRAIDDKAGFDRYQILEITPTTLRIQEVDSRGREIQPPYSYHRLEPGAKTMLEDPAGAIRRLRKLAASRAGAQSSR